MSSAMRAAASSTFRWDESSHSQTTMTFQPNPLRSLVFLTSRATFLANFSSQNAVLLFGVEAILQPSCRCQKQPWTRITVLNLGRTISGFPGRRRSFTRNLRPRACNARRRASSGDVSLERMRDIRSDRSPGERKSGIPRRYSSPPVRVRINSKKGKPRTISPGTSKDLYRHW